jgi:4-hydroxy-3-methylbut-2-enyl diphosphate reductase
LGISREFVDLRVLTMARVKVAKNAGFCMGVRRAVDMALGSTRKKTGPIYTYGPLIHNPQVLEILEGKGVKPLQEKDISQEGCAGKNGGTLIIRAHGISPQERKKIKESGIRILNATCPHVGNVQGIINRHAKNHYSIVIAGEKDHAEVQGLLGYAQGRGFVIRDLEELAGLPPMEKVCLVAQTTQDEKRFQALAAALLKKYPGAKVFNTICDSTHRRQEEVLALAKKVEAMVVVGGKGSGNTRRLVGISEAAGIPTYHVETEKDLDLQSLSRYSVVGVTAGASTPNWLILRVVDRLHDLGGRRGPASWLKALSRLMAISYLLLAFGAGCLTYTSILLQGLPFNLSSVFIAGMYVFSMHVLNRMTDKASENFNQPGRTDFYERYGQWMIATGIASAGVALLLAWFQGIHPFLLLLAISALGMIYNLRILPGRPRSAFHYEKIKDIPGSKTLLVALAWGVVTSLLPPLAQEGRFLSATPVAFLYSSILVFVRSTLYDFKDIQGDLMVGKETIPIVLGKRKTESLVVFLLIFLGAVLTAAGPLGWTTSLAPFLLFSLVYAVFYYFLYRKKVTGWGFLFEWNVDGSFVFAGLLGFLWSIL